VESPIASLEAARKKIEIEGRYKQTIAEWEQRRDFAIRLIRVDFQMKCHIAKCLRDAELRILGVDDAR